MLHYNAIKFIPDGAEARRQRPTASHVNGGIINNYLLRIRSKKPGAYRGHPMVPLSRKKS